MTKMDVSALRDKAASLSSKGKHGKALEFYEKLSTLEPTEGMWPRKEGEMHRRLDNSAAAIAAFERSCQCYANCGFVVKAVAMCKMILRIDPTMLRAQERLVAFNEERGIRVRPPVPTSPVPIKSSPPPARKSSPQSVASKASHAAPLAATSLAIEALGAKVRVVDGRDTGIIDIPIEIEDSFYANSEARDQARGALASSPLFVELSSVSFDTLISRVEFVEIAAGDDLFYQGDEGTTLYVVVEGGVSIVRSDEGSERHIAELGEGAFFGELGLVTKRPRTATARARVDSELLAIDRGLIADLIAQEPSVLKVLLRFLRERLVQDLVRTSPIFAPFLSHQRLELVKRFAFLEVQACSVLITQGQHSPALFVVLSGELVVERAVDGESPRALATLGSGDIFGEMSLLAHREAVASVRARTRCLLLELPRKVFRETIMTHPQVLAVVGGLAHERRSRLAAVAEGRHKYEELSLDLF